MGLNIQLKKCRMIKLKRHELKKEKKNKQILVMRP